LQLSWWTARDVRSEADTQSFSRTGRLCVCGIFNPVRGTTLLAIAERQRRKEDKQMVLTGQTVAYQITGLVVI
jgi:hypothetical protein